LALVKRAPRLTMRVKDCLHVTDDPSCPAKRI
jgi:hypothetical protein